MFKREDKFTPRVQNKNPNDETWERWHPCRCSEVGVL